MEEEYKHLTQNEINQIVEDKSDEKTTSEIIEDKSKENEVNRPEKSRAEMRARIIELKERARYYAATLSQTTNDRHALAEALNNLRHEFGYSAKKVASYSKTIKALREKVENHR